MIRFNVRTTDLVAGILLISIAFIIEIPVLFGMMSEGRDGIIAIILVTVFVNGFLVTVGVLSILRYCKNKRYLEKSLAKFGENNIIANIQQATQYAYQYRFSGKWAYFTNRLIVDPSTAIIDYNEISMMYKYIRTSRYGRVSYIAFAMLDGYTHYLCDYIDDAKITHIMKLCYHYNPRILMGMTRENREKHKNNVEYYKRFNK